MEEKKKCFIITPIGDDGSSIRRHIDGIIDAAIVPAINDRYEIIVAHRVTATGSINKQVIKNIYESDLVIANLTTLNPNVMYELAFRHSVRKPVITIMEKNGAKLPFDVVSERTIFYINDSKGVLELKEELEKYIGYIEETDSKDIDNPIYDSLKEIIEDRTIIDKFENSEESNMEADLLKYVIKRLDGIEDKFNNDAERNKTFRKYKIRIDGIVDLDKKEKDMLLRKIVDYLNSVRYITKIYGEIFGSNIIFEIENSNDFKELIADIRNNVKGILSANNYNNEVRITVPLIKNKVL